MPDLDPIWLKIMLATIPLAYALGSALLIVLWKLNKSIVVMQSDNHTTRLMVQSLIQKHAKRHDGECGELLNWFSQLGPNVFEQEKT